MVWEQRFHLNNLLTLLADYKDKKELQPLSDDLKKIHEEISAVKDPKELTDAKLKSIAEKIYKLRSSITN